MRLLRILRLARTARLLRLLKLQKARKAKDISRSLGAGPADVVELVCTINAIHSACQIISNYIVVIFWHPKMFLSFDTFNNKNIQDFFFQGVPIFVT